MENHSTPPFSHGFFVALDLPCLGLGLHASTCLPGHLCNDEALGRDIFGEVGTWLTLSFGIITGGK